MRSQPLPVLRFDAPQGFTGSLGSDPSAHVAMDGSATLNVHPFRPFHGPFAEQFRSSLLRELLVPSLREIRLADAPEIQDVVVPGAEAGLLAQFVEDRYGVARHRLRLAILSAGAVALVDYDANGPEAYRRHWPALVGVLTSLSVETPAAVAEPERRPATRPATGVEGLYLGITRRFVFRIGGPPGSGDWQTTMRFYLLSQDGRFHRGYGLPSVPGGDARRFDYDAAEREDAANTGTFAVTGDRLLLRPRAGDAVDGRVDGGELRAEGMTFTKAALT